MRLKMSAFFAFGLLAGTLGFLTAPAEAQTKKQTPAPVVSGTRFTSVDEDRRVRTKVIVQRRSYLDAGTEVRPGERKYTDYVFPPGYSATSSIDRTAAGPDRWMRPQLTFPF